MIYQVAWQRMLVIFSGADVHAATVVVAAFMAGLGCGSLAGGQLADRVSRRAQHRALRGGGTGRGRIRFLQRYAVLRRPLRASGPGSTSASAPPAVILLFALLWPTCLMGASMPLLARGLTNDVRRAASTVGWLYGINTLGAAVGALGTTWLLLPQAGMAGTVRVAALLNLACAAAAIPLALAGRGGLSLGCARATAGRPRCRAGQRRGGCRWSRHGGHW